MNEKVFDKLWHVQVDTALELGMAVLEGMTQLANINREAIRRTMVDAAALAHDPTRWNDGQADAVYATPLGTYLQDTTQAVVRMQARALQILTRNAGLSAPGMSPLGDTQAEANVTPVDFVERRRGAERRGSGAQMATRPGRTRATH